MFAGVVVARFGATATEVLARALVREGMASLQFLKDLVENEKIDGGLQLCGRVRGAWTAADYDMMGNSGAGQRQCGSVGRRDVCVCCLAVRRRRHSSPCYSDTSPPAGRGRSPHP